jgi:four helix bundle protein
VGDKRLDSLDVYRLAEELADRVHAVARTWRNFDRDTLGKQLVRSADSVGANIAEGYGRYTYKDRRHFLHIARGSLYETRYWLRRAYQRQLLPPEGCTEISKIMAELPPRLNAYLRSIRPPSK